MTEARAPAQNYIVATLDKNNDLYGENAHRVTSIHGRENIAAMLEKLGDDATVFIRNENKLNQMLPGNQILKSLALRAKVELDGISVADSESSVKLKYSMEDSKGRELTQEQAEYFSGSMVRDDILNLQPTSFTQKETDTAITVNPSPGVGRSTASISAQSVAQNAPSVKLKYSLEDSKGRKLTREQAEYFSGSMVRDDILNLQPTSFTEKETNAATTTNPSPGAGRNTASVSAESVAQNAPSVKQKYSLEDDTKELDAGYRRAVEKDAAENEPTGRDEGLLPEKKRGGMDYAELATEEIERTANRLLQQGYISSEDRAELRGKLFEAGVVDYLLVSVAG